METTEKKKGFHELKTYLKIIILFGCAIAVFFIAILVLSLLVGLLWT